MPECTYIPPAVTPLRLPPALQGGYVLAVWTWDAARTVAARALHRAGLHRLERSV